MSSIRQRSTNALPSPQPRAEEGLGLAQLPRILRRSIGWIVGPTLVVALGASVFVNVVSPRYTGEAKVLLESRDPAFARTAQERADQLAPIDEQAVASQVQVVMSRISPARRSAGSSSWAMPNSIPAPAASARCSAC